MEILKFFFECPFNQDEKFSDLNKIIQNYKEKEIRDYQLQLISELHQIIEIKSYLLASNIMKKYGNRKLNDLKETEKFINYTQNTPWLIKPGDEWVSTGARNKSIDLLR